MTLSIVCVTNCEPHALDFLKHMRQCADSLHAELVIGLDNPNAPIEIVNLADVVVEVKSRGYLESILDEVLDQCNGDYVLRLDDDEKISKALFDWLKSGKYEEGDVFAFPRPYLWGDDKHVLADLLPDWQTRLTTWEKSGGRGQIHSGSPYGTGRIIPFPIEHYKFLVKTREQREAIMLRYESVRPGAGKEPCYGMYNMPELYFDKLNIMDYPRC